MSGSADNRLSIRLDFQGGAEARAQLESVASTGEVALKRVEVAGGSASRGLMGAAAATDSLKQALASVNNDLAQTINQVQSFGNTAAGVARALSARAGLAGVLGGVGLAVAGLVDLFNNWESISQKLSGAVDTLTGRFQLNGDALKRGNDLLLEYNRLAETAIQRAARLTSETLGARVTANQSAQDALRADITGLQGEIDRRIGLTEARLRAARTGPGGAALSQESEDILQMEIQRSRDRVQNNPEVQRMRLEIQEREARLRDLERWGRQFQGEFAASQEAVGSVLTPPPAEPAPAREPRPARSGGMSAEERAALAEQRAQEREAAAQQRLAERQAAAEQRALEEQERRNQRVTDRIVDYGAERFADLFDKNGRGWQGMLEAFERTARLTFARIAAEAVLRPIIAPIVQGLGLGSLGNGNGGFANMFGGGSSGMGGLAQAGQAASGGGGSAGMFSFSPLPFLNMGAPNLFGGTGGLGESLGLTGAGGFLATPIYTPTSFGATQSNFFAGTALPGEAGFFAGGGGAAAPVTLGNLLGAGAMGFGLGMAGGSISGGLRGTADPTTGSAIGSMIGMGAGFLVGGPLGMMVGGAIGGTIGGLFGPTKKGMAKRSGGDVFLGVDDAGMLTITGARGKRWDQGAAVAEVQQQLDAINAQISARGLTFGGVGQAAVGFGAASGSPRELSMTALVGQLRSENANQMTAFGTLAGRGGDLEQALQAADFVTQAFEPLSKAAEKTSAFTAAMEALTKTYDEAIKKAQDLGLSEAGLNTQRAERIAKLEADRARDLDIIDRTLGVRRMALAGDTRGAGMAQFDLRAEAEMRAFKEQLFQLGLDETGNEYRRRVVMLEQTIADERLAVMRQFDQQMRGITQGLLESLTMGDLGGLPLEARYGAALASLSAAQRPLLDGATPAELAEFARVAQLALPIAKEFLGVSGSFAELVADVSRTLSTAAPGSDPANLGAILEAQVAGADRLEIAVLNTGQAQEAVLRSLLDELKRLTAQNAALLARVVN